MHPCRGTQFPVPIRDTPAPIFQNQGQSSLDTGPCLSFEVPPNYRLTTHIVSTHIAPTHKLMCIIYPQVRTCPLTMWLSIPYEPKASLCSVALFIWHSCLGVPQGECHCCPYMVDFYIVGSNCFLSDSLTGLHPGYLGHEAYIVLEVLLKTKHTLQS